MEIVDRRLPAASHLVGPGARAVLDAVVTAHDGEIVDLRSGEVAYRPDHDLVVSYRASVRWSGAEPVEETLLAATTHAGPPEGSIPVEADGMTVGVWRYPFDPSLPGLEHAVRPDLLGELLDVAPADLELSVAAYRPTRRAVVQARWPGHEVFVKVLRPHRVESLVARHERLRDAGVPAPAVLHADHELGLVVIEAVRGTELRRRLVEGGPLPSAAALHDLVAAFVAADLPAPDRPRPGLIASAPRHAALLHRIVPQQSATIDEVLATVDRLGALEGDDIPRGAHGDMHDGQVFVDEAGRIVGVIDVDDSALGDPVDDLARPLAHLIALAVALGAGTPDERVAAARVACYVRRVESDLGALVDRVALRARVAAALLGLAAGPFRAQDQDWQAGVTRLVRSARTWARLAARRDEKTLRMASPWGHPGSRSLG